ncbi:MAG: HRDC domain-containing protein [Actinomycetota bacterium]|nr:HRDC domain-containing protein [Actinomycetota bacterium]
MRVESLLDRARLVAEARADRIIAFAETRTCRHAQVAEHFGEHFVPPCGTCDVCAPLAETSSAVPPAPPLPEDVGEAIVDAVLGLTWPIGRRSLVATLCGSLKAPPSARSSLAYRLLAAATEADVKRWVQLLEIAGALAEQTTPDGFRVLTADPNAPRPVIRTGATTEDVDEGVADRLRSWRLERSRADGVPAYVVLHDSTLQELAAVKPQTHVELAGVKGFGPVKLERYADDLLALMVS